MPRMTSGIPSMLPLGLLLLTPFLQGCGDGYSRTAELVDAVPASRTLMYQGKP